MDQQYIYNIHFMLVKGQSQACNTVYMDSVLNPEVIYNTENAIHFTQYYHEW